MTTVAVWSKRIWLAALIVAASCSPLEPGPIGAEPSATAPPSPPEEPDDAPEPVIQPVAAPTPPAPELGMPIGNVMIGPDRNVPVALHGEKLARMRVIPLAPSDVDKVTDFTGAHPPGADPLENLPSALKSRIKTRALEPETNEVDVFELGGGELVLGVLEAPGAAARAAIFQRGELGVLLKVGGERGLVWVTSTRTGRPLSGAEVTIQQGSSVRHRVTSDRNGVAWLPSDKQLRLPFVVGKDDRDHSRPLVAVARSGKHVAFANESWQTGIEPWQFELPQIYYTGQDAIRGTVVSERGMYRPGDRVHLLGVLRKRLANGKLAPPPGTVKVRVTDPDANEIFNDDVTLTEFGTFRSELEITPTARLGRYSIIATKGATELRERFEVGEYRPVRFEVTLPETGPIDVKDGNVSVPISARYLYGAPVPEATVRYNVSARPKRRFGAWSDGYAFTPEDIPNELVPVGDGEFRLDATGKGEIRLSADSLSGFWLTDTQAVELVVEANVQDRAGDVVAGHSVRSWPRTPALVGLQNDTWVVNHKQGWRLKLFVAEATGAARPGKKISLRLTRRKWVSVAEGAAGSARFQGEWKNEEISTQTVTSGTAPTDLRFALTSGGQYRLEAGLEGENAHTSASVWAYGSDAYGAWDNDARMRVHSDKQSYRPGDRAKLYAEIPYAKASALLTLERQGVLEARTLEVDGAGTPIELELGERDAPNVFASLAVVPAGLEKGAPAAGPPLRVGYRELVVSAEKRRLKVDVRPATARSRPGENVDVVVRVSDATGRPARAEVTLWAADEGVLGLTGYATPDPFVAAYERHSHQVLTSANLLRFSNDISDDFSEYGGDGAPGAGSAFRSRFLGTAFFSKGVVTDARGTARVKIPLPDNLTRWRVMAAAADKGDRFGSGEAALETAKPLMIDPAFPRFSTVGDEFEATLLVHNQTARRGTAHVEVGITGAELRGDAKRAVEVDAGSQATVRFPVRADRTGELRVRAAVTMGRERDAVEITLPVHAPTLWQTELVSEGRLERPRELDVKIPATADPHSAELAVSVAPGVLAAISGSIESLLEYPHGCVEQTTSRLIPMVLLEELLRSSGDTRLAGAKHRSTMMGAVAHVLKHQNGDGGFGLWPSSSSEGFLTAYALWGLLTANEHGYAVPAGSIRRGMNYLKQHAAEGEDMHGQFAPKEAPPFAAFVLASASQDDAGLGSKLASRSKELTNFSVGLLGAAFAERDRKKTEPLLVQLASARRKTSRGSLIGDAVDNDADLFGYGSDLRATAAMVRALVLSGKAREAEDLVAGILGERRSDGTWGTTYNNLWALHALTDYGLHTEKASTASRVELAVDGRRFTTLDVTAKSRLKNALVPATRLPAPGSAAKVSLSTAPGSALRYTARLRWAPTVPAQTPVDHGFSVERELIDATTGKPVTNPTQGQLLRVRLTVKTSQHRAQVALIDRLPAGFEAVDTALATSARDPQGNDEATTKTEYGYGTWVWRELHDERVTHFADNLSSGVHTAEYLVRATRVGKFVRPAPSAEAMYEPDVFGHGGIEVVTVVR